METNQRIALDVMGGDAAPGCNLDGALAAVASGMEPAGFLLVGDETTIRDGLEARGGNPGFDVLHAPEVVGMDEKPALALRKKPGSSINVATGAVQRGLAGAHVSMGNTGAVVGAATFGLKTLEGVRRPGIAVTLQLAGAPVTILDMGANIVPKPEHLVQYAHMGSIFARDVLQTARPSVGLLNIGEEPSKGTELLQQAHALLAESRLNFVGNVEGGDIFEGAADVVVTDGFTGNVVLKLIETFSVSIMQLVLGELQSYGAQWAPEALANIKKKTDYSEYGGALLLGVNGVVVIGHGRSDDRAVMNALSLARRALDADVNGRIVRGLQGSEASPAGAPAPTSTGATSTGATSTGDGEAG